MTDTPIALITGASRGLGAALAEALCETHHIVAVARTTGALEELDDRIKAKGGSATLAPMDVTVPEAMATLCRGIHDRWGKLDMWLHTAIHVLPLTPTVFIDPKDWDKSIAINASSVSVLIPYVAPLLGEKGKAVFFEDNRVGEKFHGLYASTKVTQIALVRSFRAETARTGPEVCILEPRPMATALRARFYPGENRDTLATPAQEAARLLAELSAQ